MKSLDLSTGPLSDIFFLFGWFWSCNESVLIDSKYGLRKFYDIRVQSINVKKPKKKKNVLCAYMLVVCLS